MAIIKMIIEYDGSHFFGWQRQSKSRSVQGEIEKALKKIYKKQVLIDGAGRTDAGVHALGQVATYTSDQEIPLQSLSRALNNFLPRDIRIVNLSNEEDDFHARYSASGKTYEYKIFHSKERNVFLANYAYFYPYSLDEDLMSLACKKLKGYHNFDAFKASGSSAQNPFRTIEKIEFERNDQMIIFTFTGDGFLYKMIRLLVGFLLEVGNGRINISVLDEILKNPTRKYTSKVAPAQGLYLKKVYYEKDIKLS